MKIFAPVILIILIVLGCAGSRQKAPVNASNTSPIPGPVNPCKLTEPECKYLGGAVGYLATVIREDEKAAVTMAGATSGDSTLGEIKAAIEHAQTIENAGFFGDYSTNPVPGGYGKIDSKIQSIHKTHKAVFAEYLEYWKDSNPAHISSATAKFKKALIVTKDTVKDLNNLLDGKAAEIGKTKKP